jgi:glutamine amidotransferase
MPMDESAAAPFTDGAWLLSHNGRVDRSVLPARHDVESVCDSAVLAAHVFAEGVDQLVETVRKVAATDPGASLNLLLTDGERIIAVSWGDPMSYLIAPDGVVVASEPYDNDAGWVDVPDRHLLHVSRGDTRVTVTPLES